jgi:hypothetical protein
VKISSRYAKLSRCSTPPSAYAPSTSSWTAIGITAQTTNPALNAKKMKTFRFWISDGWGLHHETHEMSYLELGTIVLWLFVM